MPRPLSPQKYHVYSRGDSDIWGVWYWREDGGRRVRRRVSTASFITGALSRSEYTQDRAQEIVNAATGAAHVPVAHRTPALSVDWAIEYMEDRIEAEGKSSKTFRWYRDALNMLRAVFGENYSLSEFRREDVWTFQREALRTGAKPVTVNTYCRGLAGVFRRLLTSGMIEKNPLDRFERIREQSGKRHLTIEELRRFVGVLDTAKNEDAVRLLKILIYTGMRRSEVLNLNRFDVDLAGNRFLVHNVKSRTGRKRWLMIPPRARDHFEWFMARYEGDSPFARMKPDSLTHFARRYLRDAGLPEFHTHSLRHTFATLALAEGAPLRAVQKILDHTDQRITEGYVHDSADTYDIPDIGI